MKTQTIFIHRTTIFLSLAWSLPQQIPQSPENFGISGDIKGHVQMLREAIWSSEFPKKPWKWTVSSTSNSFIPDYPPPNHILCFTSIQRTVFCCFTGSSGPCLPVQQCRRKHWTILPERFRKPFRVQSPILPALDLLPEHGGYRWGGLPRKLLLWRGHADVPTHTIRRLPLRLCGRDLWPEWPGDAPAP